MSTVVQTFHDCYTKRSFTICLVWFWYVIEGEKWWFLLLLLLLLFLSPALRFKCESFKRNCMLFLFTFLKIPLMPRQSIILLLLAAVSVSIGYLWMNGLSSAVFSCFVFDCVTKCRSVCLWLIDWLMIAYTALFSALLSRLTALAHEWLAFYSVCFKYALRKWCPLMRLAWQLF